jgi:hypothetical protein
MRFGLHRGFAADVQGRCHTHTGAFFGEVILDPLALLLGSVQEHVLF